MLDLKQPLLGVVATLIGIVISLSFIALFDLASFTGTATTISAANQNMSKPYQNQGRWSQFRNTMKSGRIGLA